MSIPVILLLPTSLAASAMTMAADGGTSGGELPDGFALDPDFPMVAIGDETTQSTMAASVGEAEGGEAKVAVRGFIETTLEDVPETLGGHPVFSDPQVAHCLVCANDPPVGTSADVATLIDQQGLWDRGMTGENVAIAIMDTGFNLTHLAGKLGFTPNFDSANSWIKPHSPHNPGDYPVDHGTMCAFDALIAAPSATLIDMPILYQEFGIQPVLSNALVTFANVLRERKSGGLTGYSGVVLSNSWGVYHPSWDFPAGHPGRYIDNPKHPFILQLESLARSGIDIFFAAGNCGADCPAGQCGGITTHTIRGANASIDVMCVAGCDTTEVRVGYSSQGPSVPGIPGDKPDITAYTHFLGSEAFGVGIPDNGTSAACPVAAGCMAALRTKILPQVQGADWMNTYLLYDHFRSNAAVPAGLTPGWNGDYGHGIIRPVPVADIFGPWTI